MTTPVEEAAAVERSRPPRRQAPAGRRSTGPGWLVVALALGLLGAGSIVLSTAYDEQPEARVLGPNLPVNEGADDVSDLRANNSPTLRQNPADPANLVVANRVDSPEYSCGLHTSFDGGGRWTQTAIPAPTGVRAAKCFAPDVAFAADGTLFLTYVTLKGRANSPDAVWIARSADGGRTITPPIRTPLPANAFQVRLTTDPKVRTRLYLTWLQAGELGLYQFTEPGNPIRQVRSDDGGVTWTKPSQVSDGVRARVVAPTPATGTRDGEIYVAYLDLGEDSLDYAGGHRGQGGPPYDGKWELVVARSRDRGATWSESVVDEQVVPTERFVVFTPPTPSLAVDPEDGDLLVAFADGRFGDADVLVWKLAAGASRWSAPVRVNDTRRGDGTTQSLPAVAVAPDGRVDVLYYDRRADPKNVLNEVSLQSSFDGAATFAPRVKVSDRAFSSRIGSGLERGMADLGSRLALLSGDSRTFGVWTDTRAGSVRTAKQDLARSLVEFTRPARLSDTTELLLRIAGVALILLGMVIAVLLGRERPRRQAAP